MPSSLFVDQSVSSVLVTAYMADSLHFDCFSHFPLFDLTNESGVKGLSDITTATIARSVGTDEDVCLILK